MLCLMDGPSFKPLLSSFSAVVLHHTVIFLVLTQCCAGQSQVVGPSQSLVALVGVDISLPCYLEPAVDASDMTVEWARPDLDPRLVHVWRDGAILENKKHPSYDGRASLSINNLKHGDISLKLSQVKLSDGGKYKCFIPTLGRESTVELFVGAVSSPVISLAGIDRDKGGVVLQCESAGWYPEPEVFWLDGEGNLLSAGPTETVRGPDDLYTVSSRVTVEKRHSNNFTCRVQQKDINQTRETNIQITESKRSHRDEMDKGEQKERFKRNKPEVQVDIEAEREQLMTNETVTMKSVKNEKGERETKHFKEQQRRDEAEKRVRTLKDELETKRNEVETKQAELQQLQEEKQRKENDLQTVKEELENKNKELERIQTSRGSSVFTRRRVQNKEAELKTLKSKLETLEMELKTKIKKFKDKQAEVQQLQDQIQRMETILQTEEVHYSTELKVSEYPNIYRDIWYQCRCSDIQQHSSSITFHHHHHHHVLNIQTLNLKLERLTAEVQKFKQEKQRSEDDKKKPQYQLDSRTNEVESLTAEVQNLKQEKQRSENELKNKLETEKNEVESLTAEVQKLQQEKQRSEDEPKNQLDTRTNEGGTSSASQSSKGHVIKVEVEQWKNCIRLKNTSSEDQELGDWTLKVQITDKEPISYTFEKPFKLSPGKTLTVGGPKYISYNKTDQVWEDLKPWSNGDNLQVFLISNSGEIQHISVHSE